MMMILKEGSIMQMVGPSRAAASSTTVRAFFYIYTIVDDDDSSVVVALPPSARRPGCYARCRSRRRSSSGRALARRLVASE